MHQFLLAVYPNLHRFFKGMCKPLHAICNRKHFKNGTVLYTSVNYCTFVVSWLQILWRRPCQIYGIWPSLDDMRCEFGLPFWGLTEADKQLEMSCHTDLLRGFAYNWYAHSVQCNNNYCITKVRTTKTILVVCFAAAQRYLCAPIIKDSLGPRCNMCSRMTSFGWRIRRHIVLCSSEAACQCAEPIAICAFQETFSSITL